MKITTIGAGSIVWGSTINTDFLLNPALDGAELMLMDINADTLDLVQRYLRRLVAERGFQKTIAATTDLTEALRDADFVLVAISVGGDRLWRYDAMFPQIYGIFQPVGDTIGPGGLMRALRHATPLLRIGKTMAQVSRPGAPLIQLTNPMNPLCGALQLAGDVPVYGICHGVNDTEYIFAQRLGVAWEEVRVTAAGNNHNIFCTEVRVGGVTYARENLGELASRVFDTPFREAVYRTYGELVGNFSRHPIEFLPGFLTPESGFGRAWGVEPVAGEIDPLKGERQHRARAVLETAMNQRAPISWRPERAFHGLALDARDRAVTGHSREIIDDFIAALAYGGDFDIHLNLANEGAIAGVGDAYNVEVQAQVHGGSVTRRQARFSAAITREIERVAIEQHLIARACVEGDEDMLVEALSMDALVPDRDIAARLVREMIAFERDLIQPWQR